MPDALFFLLEENLPFKGRRTLAWIAFLQSRFFFFYVLIKMSLFIRGFHLFLIEPFHVNKFLHPTSGSMNIKGRLLSEERNGGYSVA